MEEREGGVANLGGHGKGSVPRVFLEEVQTHLRSLVGKTFTVPTSGPLQVRDQVRNTSGSGPNQVLNDPFRTRFGPVSHPFRTRFAPDSQVETRFAPVSHPFRTRYPFRTRFGPVSHPFRTRFAPASGSVSHPIRDLSRQRVWSRVIWGTGPLSFVVGGEGGGFHRGGGAGFGWSCAGHLQDHVGSPRVACFHFQQFARENWRPEPWWWECRQIFWMDK